MALYSRTVLIVDDEPLIRLTLSDALEEQGFDVIEASNVLEAIAILAKTRIDALITDVDMLGGLNGFDLMKFVTRHDPKIAVVVTSGRHRPESNELSAGCAFHSKPYRLQDIVDHIGNGLRANGDTELALVG